METRMNMELEITDINTFKEIQDKFNTAYPFLWVDFFHHPISGSTHAAPEKVKPETSVKNLCSFSGTKKVNISSDKRVIDLEQDFWEALQVKAKLLRRSGNVWVSTNYTGNWTLGNQNFEGQQIKFD